MTSLCVRYANDSVYNDQIIRTLIGSACYVEIASKIKKWQFNQLEMAIFDRADKDQSGYFSRLAQGVLPQDDTISKIKKIKKLTGKQCQIKKWREHAFWHLLKIDEPSPLETEASLCVVTGSVKKIVWDEYVSLNSPFNLRNRKMDRKDILGLSTGRNFSSLIALIAIAREGYINRSVQDYLYKSYLSLEVFPYAMMECPHLYIRWKVLAERLFKVLWQPDNYIFNYSIRLEDKLASLSSKIEQLDIEYRQRANHQLPPKEIIEEYNRGELNVIAQGAVLNNCSYRKVKQIQSEFTLSANDIAQLLCISPCTLSKRKKDGYLSEIETIRFEALAEVLMLTKEFFNGTEQATYWLNQSARALGGETPFNYMQTETGIDEVKLLLLKLEHGVFP